MSPLTSGITGFTDSSLLIDGIHNLFFLHNSENPGMSSITHPLIGPNYNSWSRAMEVALNAKIKLGFIDETIVKPPNVNSTIDARK